MIEVSITQIQNESPHFFSRASDHITTVELQVKIYHA